MAHLMDHDTGHIESKMPCVEIDIEQQGRLAMRAAFA
jgi:hypothetical protein